MDFKDSVFNWFVFIVEMYCSVRQMCVGCQTVRWSNI